MLCVYMCVWMHMCAYVLMCVFMCMDIVHTYMLCVHVSGAMRVKAGDN